TWRSVRRIISERSRTRSSTVTVNRRSMASVRAAAASAPARSPCAKPFANALRSSASRSTAGAWGAVYGVAVEWDGGSCSTPPSSCHAKGSIRSFLAARRPLHDIRLAGLGPGGDHAFFFELAADGDDLLLRLLDVAQPDRAHQIHFFLEELARALRHVAEE